MRGFKLLACLGVTMLALSAYPDEPAEPLALDGASDSQSGETEITLSSAVVDRWSVAGTGNLPAGDWRFQLALEIPLGK